MSRYDVGDRVRIKKSDNQYFGHRGTISFVLPNLRFGPSARMRADLEFLNTYQVELDNGELRTFAGIEMEAVE